jgi:hypothetical protein
MTIPKAGTETKDDPGMDNIPGFGRQRWKPMSVGGRIGERGGSADVGGDGFEARPRKFPIKPSWQILWMSL